MTARSVYVYNGTGWDEIGVAISTSGTPLPAGGAAGTVLTKASAADDDVAWSAAAGFTLQTVAHTTASLASLATEDATVTMAGRYQIVKVQTDRAARVRVYTDTAARTADTARAIGTDPDDGAGVLLDLVTTAGLLTVALSPVVDGWLASGTAVPIAVTNLSGSSSTVATTFTYFGAA